MLPSSANQRIPGPYLQGRKTRVALPTSILHLFEPALMITTGRAIGRLAAIRLLEHQATNHDTAGAEMETGATPTREKIDEFAKSYATGEAVLQVISADGNRATNPEKQSRNDSCTGK